MSFNILYMYVLIVLEVHAPLFFLAAHELCGTYSIARNFGGQKFGELVLSQC